MSRRHRRTLEELRAHLGEPALPAILKPLEDDELAEYAVIAEAVEAGDPDAATTPEALALYHRIVARLDRSGGEAA